jgi:hypothetical protein
MFGSPDSIKLHVNPNSEIDETLADDSTKPARTKSLTFSQAGISAPRLQ